MHKKENEFKSYNPENACGHLKTRKVIHIHGLHLNSTCRDFFFPDIQCFSSKGVSLYSLRRNALHFS